MEGSEWDGLPHHIRLEIEVAPSLGANERLRTIDFTAVKMDSCPEHFNVDAVCRLMEEAAMQGGATAIDIIINQLQQMRTAYVEAIGLKPGMAYFRREFQNHGDEGPAGSEAGTEGRTD